MKEKQSFNHMVDSRVPINRAKGVSHDTYSLRDLFPNSLFCSDFRYESNGIFVIGVGFFSSDKFRLFN